MNDFELNYELTGTGWAEVSFQKNSNVKIEISYLHDTLLDLSKMAISLSNGDKKAVALFMDEPGEHLLVVNNISEVVEYELRWYEDWVSWGLHPENDFEVILKGQSTTAQISNEITKVLKHLYSKYGLKGYNEKWAEHEFPIEQYELLTRA